MAGWNNKKTVAKVPKGVSVCMQAGLETGRHIHSRHSPHCLNILSYLGLPNSPPLKEKKKRKKDSLSSLSGRLF